MVVSIIRSGTAILVTGIPGSGKTTLAENLSAEFRWPILSTGDIARSVDPTGTSGGNLAHEPIFKSAFMARVRDYEGIGQTFIIDGFPRSEVQLGYLPDSIAYPILLTCRADIAADRLMRRARSDDTPEIIAKRITEQYTLLDLDHEDGWLRRVIPWGRAVNTSMKNADAIADGWIAFFKGEKRQAF